MASTVRRIARGTTQLMVLVALLASASAAHAAVTAEPSNFVAGWDGATDATIITWDVPVRAQVRVVVEDTAGRLQRVLVDELQYPGQRQTWWDGRGDAGRLLPPGQWVIRVTQRTTASDAPAQQRRARTAGVKSADSTTAVTLEQAPVSIRSVRVVRGAIGASAAAGTARAQLDVTAPASIAAVITDERGRIVRSLQTGRVAGGVSSIAWNGTTAAGKVVPDGNYSLLVAAAGDGRPTNTVRSPLRVDRTPPKLATKRAVRATSSRTNAVIPMSVSVNERATISVRAGRRQITWRQEPGARAVRLRGDLLGIVPRRVGRTVSVVVTAVDETTNVRRTSVVVVVPAAPKVAPPPRATPPARTPPPAKTTPKPPLSSTPPTTSIGALIGWPVMGPVTSEFGPRWGRMHQGIDIGVPEGTPVHASLAGIVLSAGSMDGYGIQVTLEHADGLSTRYAHMSRLTPGLVAGDRVARGAVLGASGCTGSCTGPHVHLETRINGAARDPRAFLS